MAHSYMVGKIQIVVNILSKQQFANVNISMDFEGK